MTAHRMYCVYAIGQGQSNGTGLHDKVGALNCMDDHEKIFIVYENDADVRGGGKACWYKKTYQAR